VVPARLPGDGVDALEYSAERGWEGVVAKQLDSTYQRGRRSTSWIKHKHWKTQEIVVGGWRAGEGGRANSIGALLMGIPGDGGLRYVGRVGSGSPTVNSRTSR
jgi:bifunctional non-homologous end joining protein LigD